MSSSSSHTKQIRLKYFDISSLRRDSTVLIYGRRGSGKSFFARCLMYHHQDIPKGIVISGSEEHKPFYNDFIPDSYIFYEYDPKLIENISAQQRRIVKRDGGPKKSNNFFMIMDDVLSDVQLWKKDKTLRSFFFEGRHMNLLLIIIMQYCLSLGPDLRNNFDYIFIFRDNIKMNRRRLWEHFAGVIPDFKMFEAIMEQATEDNACIVINNKSLSNRLEDCVFVYKACMHGKFRVGSSQYWKVHDDNYKATNEEETTQHIPSVASARPNVPYQAGDGIKIILKTKTS